MEFKQLESFVAVVRFHSFTKAADHLFTSQPTISSHIRMLEEELETKLIIRTTKSVEVTPRGWELYDCARNMFDLRDNLIANWRGEQEKVIRVGASTIPSAYILPEVLSAFGKNQNDVYFSVIQEDSQDILSGVAHGNYDLGLIGMEAMDDRLSDIPFYEDRMVIIAPYTEKYIKLKNDSRTDWRDILREPIILREIGSGSQKAADKFMESAHIPEEEQNVVARINDQESIKNLVAGGLGVSVISEKAVQDMIENHKILSFEIPGENAARKLHLIYRKDYVLRRQVKDFVSFILKYYKAI